MLKSIDLGPRLNAYATVAYITTPQRGTHALTVDVHDGATHALIPLTELATSTLCILSERIRAERDAMLARRLTTVRA